MKWSSSEGKILTYRSCVCNILPEKKEKQRTRLCRGWQDQLNWGGSDTNSWYAGRKIAFQQRCVRHFKFLSHDPTQATRVHLDKHQIHTGRNHFRIQFERNGNAKWVSVYRGQSSNVQATAIKVACQRSIRKTAQKRGYYQSKLVRRM